MQGREPDRPIDPTKIFPVSWDQFHRDSRALARRLSGAGPFEAIVCITRGGLVPAGIVARELGIRVIETVCIASYDHTRQADLTVLKDVAASVIARGGGEGAGVRQNRKGGARAAARGAFRDGLRQAHGPTHGRHVHYRSVAGHLDLFSLGYRACISAADL